MDLYFILTTFAFFWGGGLGEWRFVVNHRSSENFLLTTSIFLGGGVNRSSVFVCPGGGEVHIILKSVINLYNHVTSVVLQEIRID